MRATRFGIRRSLLCSMALLGFVLPARAQQVKRDIDYRLLPQPQSVQTGERVEVIDFFFYACPYCNELAPHLDRWIKRKPADVVFVCICRCIAATTLTIST